jgi:hypothetical protein
MFYTESLLNQSLLEKKIPDLLRCEPVCLSIPVPLGIKVGSAFDFFAISCSYKQRRNSVILAIFV